MIELGKKLRTLREIKGYSQEYVANEIDISQRTYSKIENGLAKIDIERLQKIANVLEVDLINILDEKSNVFNNYNKVENFGHIYISSKEFIQHLLDENKFLKEQLEILTKILSNNTN